MKTFEDYWLFLDDERWPEQDTWVPLPSRMRGQYVIVRSYDEFVKAVKEYGVPKFVTFDHDLAEEHYKEGFAGVAPLYDQYKEKTGYHAAEWLVHHCAEQGFTSLPDYQAHTMSPVGRENIHRVMNADNYLRLLSLTRNLSYDR